MKNRGLIIIGAIIVGLLAVWQFWASPQPKQQQEATAPVGDVLASQSKEYTLDVGDSTTLDIPEAAGSIMVFTGPPGQVYAIVTKRSFGVDQESAKRDLDSFSIEPQKNGGTISFGSGKNIRAGRQVDYKITAPLNTSLRVGNGYGSITINGTRGNVDIHGQNLNITITDVRGSIAIESETGAIKLADTTGALKIQSRTASIQMDRGTGPSIAITTGANTTLKDSGADTNATFSIQKGDLTLTRFRAGTLTAIVPDGQIRINESTTQQADLQTQDGLINLYRMNAGKLRATTTTGELAMDQIQGSIDIKTQKGGINLTEAAVSALNIAAGSGNVTFYGALPVFGEHTIKTTSGNIYVYVVKESAFRLDASTKGTITIDPPFVLESADKGNGRWRGVINQGSILLALTSTSGNILISSDQPY